MQTMEHLALNTVIAKYLLRVVGIFITNGASLCMIVLEDLIASKLEATGSSFLINILQVFHKDSRS